MTNMTDDERAALRAEIRDYLLENPDILLDVQSVLQQRALVAKAAQERALVASLNDQIFDDGFSWVGGNPDGDVTIVEFLDYRCKYCRQAHAEIASLLESDGNIRWVVKEFPILGDQSLKAAHFAMAVRQVGGDAAYAKVHDILMTMAGTVAEGWMRRTSRDLGLDDDAVLAAMESDEITRIIGTNYGLAQTLEITGTPGFIIGDRVIHGYMPQDQLARIVAEARTG